MLLAAATVTMVVALAGPAVAGSPAPRQNIQPSPDFMNACVVEGTKSTDCVADAVQAIESARASEPMLRQALILPRNYRALSPARQAFVVMNLERVDRGLRPIAGMVAGLNRTARAAAAAGIDPQPPTTKLRRMGVRVYRTVYARAYGVLAADYEWMYDDGFSPEAGRTTNSGCPYPDAPGCWGHRAAILERFKGLPRLSCGIGRVRAGADADKLAAILTGGGRSPAPRYTYTWREALSQGADGYGST